MRKGTYMVYIYVKNKNTDDQQILQVLLEDGVGKIEVFAGGIKSTADLALSFKGYTKLETGILSIE
jgi:methylmalonyl-CoA mutase cobalamin-binding subunit